MNNLFDYRFSNELTAPACYWTNFDGSEGGIVAADANIDDSVIILKESIVFPGVIIGKDTAIFNNVIIGKGTTIGEYSTILDDTHIGHRVRIRDHVYINDHVHIGDESSIHDGTLLLAEVKIGRCAHIGKGALIDHKVNIRDGTIITPWSVLTKDTEIPEEICLMRKQQGFNLIELMMVLAIISILSGTSVPTYQHYVAKSQVTAALADITPGKAQTEMRLANGMPRTTLANDIDLRDVTTHCRRIDVVVEVPSKQFDASSGVTVVNASPMSSITCAIRGNAQVNNKTIEWVRISDAQAVLFDDQGNDLNGQWFCRTNVDEALRPISCKEDLQEMNQSV